MRYVTAQSHERWGPKRKITQQIYGTAQQETSVSS